MKQFLTLLVFTALCAAGFSAAPTDLTLATGTTLHRVSVVRWERERVVVKHSGGSTDTIYYSHMAPASKVAFEAARDAESGKRDPNTGPRTVTGQVFITTQGAGAYKFAGATVRAFTESQIDSARSIVPANTPQSSKGNSYSHDRAMYIAWDKSLESFKPVEETTTDAEGHFTLKLNPAGDYILVCLAHRVAGSSDEYTGWAVSVKDANTVDLNGKNELF